MDCVYSELGTNNLGGTKLKWSYIFGVGEQKRLNTTDLVHFYMQSLKYISISKRVTANSPAIWRCTWSLWN
jgi:hypothetical protein